MSISNNKKTGDEKSKGPEKRVIFLINLILSNKPTKNNPRSSVGIHACIENMPCKKQIQKKKKYATGKINGDVVLDFYANGISSSFKIIGSKINK